ncbi:RNA-binding S4 domain-containing protein [Thalassomonas actiniarum]|uniref:RNA-binding S4 domain-containing protein n=1 Tax=Thalassomonas actiniarum TaxID=485447 RepID=A0AAE9YN18_9GAMM|nr:RNA-binding S4 domain-containing protein [Thalassomonas actiniarum]WDD97139.1 RNA-binding S4 domain-containing protein [Thalassomonas actiniarum]
MQEDIEYQVVEITEQPIALCQLLKIANMVGGGGEAKIVISEGYVLLNNEVEYQKRKKVFDGDIVEFNGDAIQIRLVEQEEPAPATDMPPPRSKKAKQAQQKPSTKKKAAKKPPEPEASQGKRRPISF